MEISGIIFIEEGNSNCIHRTGIGRKGKGLFYRSAFPNGKSEDTKITYTHDSRHENIQTIQNSKESMKE
jgi:hypothetical protein